MDEKWLFDMQGVFDGWRNGSLLQHIQVIREFPRGDEYIDKYEVALEQAARHHQMKLAGPKLYETEILFGELGSYRMLWNVDRALQVIKERHLRPKSFIARDMLQFVDVENLDEKHVKKINRQRHPLIVGDYPMIAQRAILIDGNHTVFAMYHQDPQTIMHGYVLNSREHMAAMASDLFRALYKIHYNITEMARYMAGETDGVALIDL